MASKPKLTDVKGVAASRAKQLETLKIRTVEDLAAADEAELTTIKGITPIIAQNLKSAAATLLRVREITDDEPDSIEVTPELLARLRNSDDQEDTPEPQALSKPKAAKSKDKVAKPAKAAKKSKNKADKPKKDKADKPKKDKADKPKKDKADKPKKDKKVDMVTSLERSVKAEAKALKKAGKKAAKKALKFAHELAEKAVSKAGKQAAKLAKKLEKQATKLEKKAANQADNAQAEATEQSKGKDKKSKK